VVSNIFILKAGSSVVLVIKELMMTAFWDIMPCSLVEINRRIRGAYCHIIRAINKPHAKNHLEIMVFDISHSFQV
jgi:hypothetical protein